MNNSGFYLSQLRVIGEKKYPAEIKFKAGSNLITGASNTGKSYIFKCINYMLGSSEAPKDIIESRGYTHALLEIKTYDNKIFTLKRPLLNDNFQLAECSIDDFDTYKDIKELKAKHDATSNDNISRFLLLLSGFDDEKIRINAQNKYRPLSFRDIANFILVDEEHIITDQSPILSGQVIMKTAEKSTFHLLLTGNMNHSKEVSETIISKTVIKTKLEFLKELISETAERIEDIKNISKEETLESLNSKLTNLSKILSETEIGMSKLFNERTDLWSSLETSKSKITMLKEILKRFNILKDYYKVDLERMNFILDGDYLLSQLNTISCPLCGQQINEEHYKCSFTNEKEETINLKDAIKTESEKILQKQSDLNKSIKELSFEIKKLAEDVEHEENSYKSITMEINDKLQPLKNFAQVSIEKLIKQHNDIVKLEATEVQLNQLYTIQTKLTGLLNQPNLNFSESREEVEKRIELMNELKNVLSLLNYPSLGSVNFNSETFDIDISGKGRGSSGKGYRAITFSAFVITLLYYSIKLGLPHPRLLVLDSPLTPFRGSYEDEEGITHGMQEAFFSLLVNVPKDRQIIVFDNKEPNKQMKDQINYIHFSGTTGVGREGFFPKNSSS